jgi:oligoribonuclease NrnB/cAMP/cGMP phosphodiesterase (DHH superfamily)
VQTESLFKTNQKMNPEPDIVVYHGDQDGFCGAWLLHHVFPNAEYVKASYGDRNLFDFIVGISSNKIVFFVDFTFSLLRENYDIAKIAKHVVIMDHHKTAIEKLNNLECNNVTKILDNSRSGCKMVYDWLIENDPYVPLPCNASSIVSTVCDYDLWTFKLAGTQNIFAAIASYPMTFDSWNRMCLMSNGALYAEGAIIERYRATLVDSIIKDNIVMLDLNDEIRIFAVNTQNEFAVAGSKLSKLNFNKHKIGATFYFNYDGMIVSLRSPDDGPDVSDIAKKFGGGGHAHAAGFQVKYCDILMLSNGKTGSIRITREQ